MNKADENVKKANFADDIERDDVESLFRKGQDVTVVFDKAENTFTNAGEIDFSHTFDGEKTMSIDAVKLPSEHDNSGQGEVLVEDEKVEKRRSNINHRRKMKNATITSARVFWGILLSVFIVSVSAFLAVEIIVGLQDITGIAKKNQEIDVEIPRNADTTTVGKILKDKGVIKNDWVFNAYINFTKTEDNYKEGLYTLSPKMSVSDILFELRGNKMVLETVKVTIIEGMNAEKIGELLEENHVCRAKDFRTAYTKLMNKYSFENRLTNDENKFYQLEGFLFPNTYEFFTVSQLKKTDLYDTTEQAETAVKKMLEEFNRVIKPYYSRMEEMEMSLNEVITLASIIQKEATTMESMEMVSSVFHNRLNKAEVFPKLESDVTSHYVKNVIKPHFPVDSYAQHDIMFKAYDTYETFGLPVGPICNPGEDAIKAALYPASTLYYFFLTDKEMNNFYYAENNEQHEANKKKAGLV